MPTRRTRQPPKPLGSLHPPPWRLAAVDANARGDGGEEGAPRLRWRPSRAREQRECVGEPDSPTSCWTGLTAGRVEDGEGGSAWAVLGTPPAREMRGRRGHPLLPPASGRPRGGRHDALFVLFFLPLFACRGGSARYAYPQPDGYGHAHHAAFRPSPAAPRQLQHSPPRSGSGNFPFCRDFSQLCAGSSHVIRLRKVSDSVCIPCGARPEAFPATPSVPLTALGTTLGLVGIRDVLHLPSAASVAPFSLSPLALYAFAGRRHPPLSSCPSLSVCRVPLWFLIFSWAAALLPPAGHGAPPLHPPLRDICVVSGSWARNPRPVTVLPLP